MYNCEHCHGIFNSEIERAEHYAYLHYDEVGELSQGSVVVPAEVDPMAFISDIRKGAVAFGAELMDEFIDENIAMSITQLGMTRTVGLELKDLSFWLEKGSLYEALADVVAMRAAGFDPAHAPFLTDERMGAFEGRLREYLGI